MKKLLTTLLLTLSISLSLGASISYATVPSIPKASTLPGPEDSGKSRKTLTEGVLPKFAVTFTGFIAAVALLFVIIAGVRFAIAYGEEEAVTKAKDQVIWSLAGLVIAILAYSIVNILVTLQFESDQEDKAPPQFLPAPAADQPAA